tara:strand:+ start:13342 stop:13758 length:417 start_codon:yes stop_codon:yes gene_type:complete
MRLMNILFLFGFLFAEQDVAMNIKKSLMSPCCWAGTVYDLDHNPEMEEQIKTFIDQGKSEQEIIDHYVDLYGERILAIPIAKGFNIMVWVAPIIVGLLAIGILIIYLKSPQTEPESVIFTSSDIPFDDEIERELKEMD